MIPRRLTNLTMLAIFFSCPTLAATADPGHGAELVRLHVAKASDVLARRLPGNAGHIQVLFERQTPRGLIGLMRLEIERGAVGLDELLRPDMVPEVAYVLQGLTELEVPDSKAKRQLATGDLVYRPNRGTRFGSNGKSRQPVRLLLWALVPLTSTPLAPVEPMFRSIHGAREYRLPGGKGMAKVALDQRIAAQAVVSLELVTVHRGGAVGEHAHPSQAEIWFVTQGAGTLTIEGQDVPLVSGHAVYLPPGVRHSFKATSKEVFTALRSYVPPAPEQQVQVGRKP
jgi:quercetin dioxygenase-like cupin family protein